VSTSATRSSRTKQYTTFQSSKHDTAKVTQTQIVSCHNVH